MATLKSWSFNGSINWRQEKALTGFLSATQQGPLSFSVSSTPSDSTVNEVYPLQGTLAPSGSITINLSSLTMPAFGDAINPVRAYTVGIKGDGAAWRYEPGAVSGFAGFLGGTGPTISGGDGECFVFAGKTALTIDGSHKNITITNLSGSATLTYTLAIILGK